jgi:hypothetical protein
MVYSAQLSRPFEAPTVDAVGNTYGLAAEKICVNRENPECSTPITIEA